MRRGGWECMNEGRNVEEWLGGEVVSARRTWIEDGRWKRRGEEEGV